MEIMNIRLANHNDLEGLNETIQVCYRRLNKYKKDRYVIE